MREFGRCAATKPRDTIAGFWPLSAWRAGVCGLVPPWVTGGGVSGPFWVFNTSMGGLRPLYVSEAAAPPTCVSGWAALSS